MIELLALINDTLQAIIAIFGAAVVLYNVEHIKSDRIVRAFTLLLTGVVLVYFTELLVSRTELIGPAKSWLLLKWIGITFVPAAQFHLSDALLIATGSTRPIRRFVTVLIYFISTIFYGIILFSDLIVQDPIVLENVIYLEKGILFPLFAITYIGISIASLINVYQAYQRCIIRTTKKRIGYILGAIIAAPLSVFPYMGIVPQPNLDQIPIYMWVILILGNLLVGGLFALLTTNISYLGSVSSDRIVWVKLVKFMARVPLTASIVLLVYILTNRATSFLGLSADTATAFTVVGTVIMVEWAIHAYKRPLERLLQFNVEPDVRQIQQLHERLLTSRDLNQYLESLLAAGCDRLRIPTAFVATVDGEYPTLASAVGSKASLEKIWTDEQQTSMPTWNNTDSAERIEWNQYWVYPLHSETDETMIGFLGLQAVSELDDPSEDEAHILQRLIEQSAKALEDQLLQKSIFAAVQGLLPSITARQQELVKSTFDTAQLLAEKEEKTVATPKIEEDEFRKLVKDALNHYWGGPKLTQSPLLQLEIVQTEATQFDGNPVKALRSILQKAIERQRPPEENRSLTRTEWLLYNILELKFVQGKKVRDVAQRLAMSESDLYRKQRVAIENVALAIMDMESEQQLSETSERNE